MTDFRVLDLFSGIGGFALGLERAGMRTVAFCEIEPFARSVLKKHWPEVPIYDDVRSVSGDRLRSDGIAPTVICGGFPCQDISTAGRGAGLAGERSGLWREYARIVGEVRPRFVIVENVAALLSRGLGDVLGDLAALGYDAEWHCIPASAVGAPHRRDRVWVVAYPHGVRELQPQRGQQDERGRLGDSGADVADADSVHGEGQQPGRVDSEEWQGPIVRSLGSRGDGGGWWIVEPDVDRVVNGLPHRSHRLRALGNAVVPQIPEIIGRAIVAHAARAAA